MPTNDWLSWEGSIFFWDNNALTLFEVASDGSREAISDRDKRSYIRENASLITLAKAQEYQEDPVYLATGMKGERGRRAFARWPGHQPATSSGRFHLSQAVRARAPDEFASPFWQEMAAWREEGVPDGAKAPPWLWAFPWIGLALLLAGLIGPILTL